MTAYLTPFVGLVQFTSLPYLVFLALAVVVYFGLPGPRSRAAWLLGLSAGLYLLMSPGSLGALVAVTAVSYGAGLWLGSSDAGEESDRARAVSRRSVVVGAVVVLVGALAFFKYGSLFARLGNYLIRSSGFGSSAPLLEFLLPLGVSFWVFQAIAYVVDVYKGRTRPEKNLLYFVLAVTFFPIVMAGPITRVQDLTTQAREKHRFDYDGMQSGLLLLGRGFFKKLLIADRLALFVNTVFGHPRSYAGATQGSILLVAAVFFALQLYFDFSGYTDIVRGSARLMGFELPINFRAPYFARSVRDFWRRWHMTLMDWLKVYVYIPLGGSHRGIARRYLNVMIVFAISGLWHGAGLTYLVWGLLNGFYQVVGELLAPARDRFSARLGVDRSSAAHHVFQTMFTFLLVTVAWVFFRAASVGDALYIVTRMFFPTVWVFTDGSLLQQGLGALEMGVALTAAVLVFALEWISLNRDVLLAVRSQSLVYRWVAYYGLVCAIVVFGAYGGTYQAADFVYFKF